MENSGKTIAFYCDATRDRQVRKYPKLLKAITRIMHLHLEQELSLHGLPLQESSLDDKYNCGNLIPQRTNCEKCHILSPSSQNEMIEVLGKHTIQTNLIKAIKNAEFHSTSTEEVTANKKEILSICMR